MKNEGFEAMIERLTAINNELEAGNTDLETAIALFKEGTTLAGKLTKKLEAAELEIKQLADDADEET